MSAIREMTVDAVVDGIGGYLAVDVREEHEFHGPLGHVDTARLHPLGSIPQALEGTEADRSLLLICRSGKRSRRACEVLLQAGFTDVTNLEGGMIAWNEASLPVRRTEFKSIQDLVASIVAYLSQVTAATPGTVENSMGLLLEEAGSSVESPTSSALEWVLQELADGARQPNLPADLDLVVAAYRRDLAVL